MSDSAGWRRLGKELRKEIVENDGVAAIRLSNECPLQQYLNVSESVMNKFIHHPIDSRDDLLQAYVLGNRLYSFLTEGIPSHVEYDFYAAEACNQNLPAVTEYLEKLALLIDEQEHSSYVTRVISTSLEESFSKPIRGTKAKIDINPTDTSINMMLISPSASVEYSPPVHDSFVSYNSILTKGKDGGTPDLIASDKSSSDSSPSSTKKLEDVTAFGDPPLELPHEPDSGGCTQYVSSSSSDDVAVVSPHYMDRVLQPRISKPKILAEVSKEVPIKSSRGALPITPVRSGRSNELLSKESPSTMAVRAAVLSANQAVSGHDVPLQQETMERQLLDLKSIESPAGGFDKHAILSVPYAAELSPKQDESRKIEEHPKQRQEMKLKESTARQDMEPEESGCLHHFAAARLKSEPLDLQSTESSCSKEYHNAKSTETGASPQAPQKACDDDDLQLKVVEFRRRPDTGCRKPKRKSKKSSHSSAVDDNGFPVAHALPDATPETSYLSLAPTPSLPRKLRFSAEKHRSPGQRRINISGSGEMVSLGSTKIVQDVLSTTSTCEKTSSFAGQSPNESLFAPTQEENVLFPNHSRFVHTQDDTVLDQAPSTSWASWSDVDFDQVPTIPSNSTNSNCTAGLADSTQGATHGTSDRFETKIAEVQQETSVRKKFKESGTIVSVRITEPSLNTYDGRKKEWPQDIGSLAPPWVVQQETSPERRESHASAQVAREQHINPKSSPERKGKHSSARVAGTFDGVQHIDPATTPEKRASRFSSFRKHPPTEGSALMAECVEVVEREDSGTLLLFSGSTVTPVRETRATIDQFPLDANMATCLPSTLFYNRLRSPRQVKIQSTGNITGEKVMDRVKPHGAGLTWQMGKESNVELLMWPSETETNEGRRCRVPDPLSSTRRSSLHDSAASRADRVCRISNPLNCTKRSSVQSSLNKQHSGPVDLDDSALLSSDSHGIQAPKRNCVSYFLR